MLEVIVLLGRRRHDKLAAAPVRNASLLAIAIKRVAPLHAELRLEATGIVVNPGVDHLAVARGRSRADRRFLLHNDDLNATQRQCPGNRKTDHSCSNNHGLDLEHASTPVAKFSEE